MDVLGRIWLKRRLTRWSTLALAFVLPLSLAGAPPALSSEEVGSGPPRVGVTSPSAAEPAVARAGDAVEVSFDANRAWPYVVDIRADAGEDWTVLGDAQVAHGGANTVEALIPAGVTAGTYDVRLRLFAPGPVGVALGTDIASSALEVVPPLTTGFEDRGGHGWTTHQEELDFLAALADASPRVDVTEIGESVQGRPLHVIRLGHPAPPTDADIAAGSSVLAIGSQHGVEPAGREMALQMARDLAFTDDPALLEQLEETTVLFIPTANPDGREANTRGNANGVDVNRDHLRLSTPEGQAIASTLRDLTPELVVDAHERPGGVEPDMELVWSLNLNVDPELRALAQEMVEDHVFPGLQAAGFTTGELGRPGTTAYDERILRNAIGLRHSIGVVTETPWDGEPLRRVAAQLTNFEQILAFQRAHFDEVADVTAAAALSRAADGAAGARVHFGGPDDPVVDPAACGYLINTVQAAEVERHVALFGLDPEQVSEHGVFLTMASPMMTVVPLLLDERASFNVVAGRALDDCSDPGSEDPPELPPDPTPPAQYSTDFSDDAVGQPPMGWTPQWRASQWTILDGPRRLQHSVEGPSGRRGLTWDDVGENGVVHGDVEIFGLVRAPQAGDTMFQMGVHISGEAGSENAYYVDARSPDANVTPNQLRINRYSNGTASFPGGSVLPFTVEQGVWYRVVLQRSGDTLRAKMWPDGAEEPSWQVIVPVDQTHDGGRVGVSHFTPGTVNHWAFIGVGTGGEPAPRAP